MENTPFLYLKKIIVDILYTLIHVQSLLNAIESHTGIQTLLRRKVKFRYRYWKWKIYVHDVYLIYLIIYYTYVQYTTSAYYA